MSSRSISSNRNFNITNTNLQNSKTILVDQIVGNQVDGKEIISEKIFAKTIEAEKLNNIDIGNTNESENLNLTIKNSNLTEEIVKNRLENILNVNIGFQNSENNIEDKEIFDYINNNDINYVNTSNIVTGYHNNNFKQKYLTEDNIKNGIENSNNIIYGADNFNDTCGSSNILVGNELLNNNGILGNGTEYVYGSTSNILIGNIMCNSETNTTGNIGLGNYCLNSTKSSANIAIGNKVLSNLDSAQIYKNESYNETIEVSNDYNICIGNNSENSLVDSSNNITIGNSTNTKQDENGNFIKIKKDDSEQLSQNNAYIGNNIRPLTGIYNEIILGSDAPEIYLGSLMPSIIPSNYRGPNNIILGNLNTQTYFLPGLVCKSDTERFNELKTGSLYIDDDDIDNIDDYINNDFSIKVKNIFDQFNFNINELRITKNNNKTELINGVGSSLNALIVTVRSGDDEVDEGVEVDDDGIIDTDNDGDGDVDEVLDTNIDGNNIDGDVVFVEDTGKDANNESVLYDARNKSEKLGAEITLIKNKIITIDNKKHTIKAVGIGKNNEKKLAILYKSKSKSDSTYKSLIVNTGWEKKK